MRTGCGKRSEGMRENEGIDGGMRGDVVGTEVEKTSCSCSDAIAVS